jgi:hypothetical protein
MSQILIPNTSADLKKLVRRQLRHQTRALANESFDPWNVQKQFAASPCCVCNEDAESDCATLGCVKLFSPFFFGATDSPVMSPKKNCRDLEVRLRRVAI